MRVSNLQEKIVVLKCLLMVVEDVYIALVLDPRQVGLQVLSLLDAIQGIIGANLCQPKTNSLNLFSPVFVNPLHHE